MHKSYIKRVRSNFGGYTPQQICQARGWDGKLLPAVPINLGYLSLGGVISDADIQAQSSVFGLRGPKVTRIGTPQASDPNGANVGANVENSLDLWSAWIFETLTGTQPNLTVAFANNDASGLPRGIDLLRSAGVQVASCSWGSPESNYSLADLDTLRKSVQAAKAAGMWLTVASGDNSEDDGTNVPTVDCPSCIPESIAVGGTTLTLSPSVLDKAWGDGAPGDTGGGGGYSKFYSRPLYQNGFVQRNNRGVPDCSESADPQYGYLVISDGQAMTVGGTSGAAPTVAGYLAVARGYCLKKGSILPSDINSWLYANAVNIFADVVLGSDGIPAVIGWDACTGNGTIKILSLINYMAGVTQSPPPITTNPPTPPPTQTPPPITIPPGLQQYILSAIDSEFKRLEGINNMALNELVLMPLNKVIDLAVMKAFQAYGSTAHDQRLVLRLK